LFLCFGAIASFWSIITVGATAKVWATARVAPTEFFHSIFSPAVQSLAHTAFAVVVDDEIQLFMGEAAVL
jgi:hypothetical protein